MVKLQAVGNKRDAFRIVSAETLAFRRQVASALQIKCSENHSIGGTVVALVVPERPGKFAAILWATGGPLADAEFAHFKA
jgi:hypothetical protein